MADEAKYRVGMVSKMTGLSTHTLRMWEKRYAAVLPKRTEAGGRLYTDDDVERLRLLHNLVQSGHSIGGIAKLPDADLRSMAAAFPAPSRYIGRIRTLAAGKLQCRLNAVGQFRCRCVATRLLLSYHAVVYHINHVPFLTQSCPIAPPVKLNPNPAKAS